MDKVIYISLGAGWALFLLVFGSLALAVAMCSMDAWVSITQSVVGLGVMWYVKLLWVILLVLNFLIFSYSLTRPKRRYEKWALTGSGVLLAMLVVVRFTDVETNC